MLIYFLIQAEAPLKHLEGQSDEDLMRAFQDGDNAAFELLLGRYEKAIYRFCWRFIQNCSAAEDATQETFYKVIKNAKKWQEKAKFKMWLYQIARNYCIDFSRRSANKKHSSLNDKVHGEHSVSQSKLDLLQSSEKTSEQHLDDLKLATAINKGLSLLPEEQREVFCLRQYEGFKFRHIAQVIGIKESTAKSRMRYALESMQKELFNEGYGSIQVKAVK